MENRPDQEHRQMNFPNGLQQSTVGQNDDQPEGESVEIDPNRYLSNNQQIDSPSSTSIQFWDDLEQEFLIAHYSCFDSNTSILSDRQIAKIQNQILEKPKPKPTSNTVPDLYYREIGLTGRHKKFFAGQNLDMFHYRLSGSLYIVERLQLWSKMEHHTFDVYSVHFNKSGSLIVFGSDDLKIVLWKWSTNKIVYEYDNPHHLYVYQTKFLEFDGSLNIISSARDGQVIRAQIPTSGGPPIITTMAKKYAGTVYNFTLPPTSPFEVLTVGEDARVFRYDFRENFSEKLLSVKENGKRVPLYSVAAHPIVDEFCICGGDEFVRVYDKRNVREPVVKMAPNVMLPPRSIEARITCAVYNYTGTEILAAYNSNEIFLFENKVNVLGNYLHRYQGHNNYFPMKVNFFGPRSEFVMSGSNCGNCFFWDKNTEAIVQWMPGEITGYINCPEPHPSFPILATSGCDDIKIWGPSVECPPNINDLRRCIDENLRFNRDHID